VAASIQAYGFGAPLIARQANGEVIGGHTRLKAALHLGMTHVPVRYLDLDEKQAHALAIADNKLGELAEWDDKLLSGILAQMHDEVDLGVLGFTDAELGALIGPTLDAAMGVPTPPPAVPPSSVLGAQPHLREPVVFYLTQEQAARVKQAFANPKRPSELDSAAFMAMFDAWQGTK
jgi:ParB-like chromosome segregation protein Spo0J